VHSQHRHGYGYGYGYGYGKSCRGERHRPQYLPVLSELIKRYTANPMRRKEKRKKLPHPYARRNITPRTRINSSCKANLKQHRRETATRLAH
jgi:hypothetical protein